MATLCTNVDLKMIMIMVMTRTTQDVSLLSFPAPFMIVCKRKNESERVSFS